MLCLLSFFKFTENSCFEKVKQILLNRRDDLRLIKCSESTHKAQREKDKDQPSLG